MTEETVTELETNPQGETGTPETPSDSTSEEQSHENDMFPRSYVEELREEAASWRVKAKKAEGVEEALRALAIEHYARGVLADVSALEWTEDMANDDGMPDGAKIREAAEALLKEHPSLGRPRGNVLAGEHSEQAQGFSWSMLGSLV